jgi:hypothetical protein
MKKTYLLIITVLILFSCEKVDDDFNEICTENCTTLSGKVYTQGNTPLKNVAMKFKFQTNDPQNNNITLTRILSKVRTNNLGEYRMNFYLKDEELGEWVGSFTLNADKNTIPSNVFYEDYFNLFDNLYNILTRDVEIQRNLYIPTLKRVKIKLNGFNGPATEDYFRVLVEVPCGYDRPIINPESGNNHEYATIGLNKYQLNNYNNLTSKIFEISLALNETNFIVLGRMKNNIYSEERIPIQVTSTTNQTLEYNYE